MFFISQSRKDLTVKSLSTARVVSEVQSALTIIERPQIVIVLGNSSIYENFIQGFTDVNTLTFMGRKLFESNLGAKGVVYALTDDIGYVLHNIELDTVYLSRSMAVLNDFAIDSGLGMVDILRSSNNGEYTVIPEINLNNDFSRRHLSNENVDPNTHLNFDLGWTESDKQIPFNMAIKNEGYSARRDGMFYVQYNGYAPNIGNFEQLVIKTDSDIRFPDFFPERNLDRAIVFTNLEDDNALHILTPNVMLPDEFDSMILSMQQNMKTHTIFSGMHRSGYGVQAVVELLPDGEGHAGYKAKVTKLICTPNPLINENFIFRAINY